MAGRSIVVFFNAPAQAFFGEQARDEGVVGFLILHAVAARPGVGEKRAHFLAPLPRGEGRVCAEHCIGDLDDGLFLKHAVVTAAREQPAPRYDDQPVASEAAVGAQTARRAHEAGSVAARAVGQRAVQGERLAEEAIERDVGVGGKHVDAQLEAARQRGVRPPRFDHHGRAIITPSEIVQTRGGREQLEHGRIAG